MSIQSAHDKANSPLGAPDRYAKIRELGLSVQTYRVPKWQMNVMPSLELSNETVEILAVDPSGLLALIEQAPRVYSCSAHLGKACALWSNDDHAEAHNTHTALLLAIKPLAVDTAEGLLRELLEEWKAGRVYAPSDKRNLYERARALLKARE